ncbi:actin-like protein [Blastocystis sp. subtype 4]|uniref:actin-like protein n=1 Tax=Blastocystis sp. subtype 4 TaxID=944170 RepID=UPI000711ACA8|nr:actin-like protein [Blastocystis sp. subtype 4]KNB43443.1 actin-like protein [Blastocystis sp. subtype 4]|eukprot:XP_014526886.1 actin-like protein [Blastocystis sp. subtype 4]
MAGKRESENSHRLFIYANTLKPYLDCIQTTLRSTLILQNFPSESVERHNKPEIEIQSSKISVMKPILICRTEKERCFIEPSINSVRVSIKIKQSDEMESVLCRNFTRFLMQRAENFAILRRKPVDGYDISFLVTFSTLEEYDRERIISFILDFMEGIDSEISAMKIGVNARARGVAAQFMRRFV